MDLEKGGGKNENYDNAEALENYYFEHKKKPLLLLPRAVRLKSLKHKW